MGEENPYDQQKVPPGILELYRSSEIPPGILELYRGGSSLPPFIDRRIKEFLEEPVEEERVRRSLVFNST